MNHDVQLLVFQLDLHRYGVRLAQVARVVHAVELTPLPGAPEVVLGVMSHRGHVLPVVNLRKRFDYPQREVTVDDQFVIVHAGSRSMALAVDQVQGIVERPERDLIRAENILDHAGQFTGAVQLGTDLIMIHDLDRTLSEDELRCLDQALTGRDHDAR
jgi:purine-binding chemotaxis protein CheW